MTKRGPFMCYCGHWSHLHIEYDDGIRCQGKLPKLSPSPIQEPWVCGCDMPNEDVQYMRELENEEKVRRYDAWREK